MKEYKVKVKFDDLFISVLTSDNETAIFAACEVIRRYINNIKCIGFNDRVILECDELERGCSFYNHNSNVEAIDGKEALKEQIKE